jgi:hypothetical protein
MTSQLNQKIYNSQDIAICMHLDSTLTAQKPYFGWNPKTDSRLIAWCSFCEELRAHTEYRELRYGIPEFMTPVSIDQYQSALKGKRRRSPLLRERCWSYESA